MKQEFIHVFNTLNNIGASGDKSFNSSRGLEFEKLINDVFDDEGVLLRRSYHTQNDRSEQLDGAIEVWNRVLLHEVKWVTSNLAASELYAFIGKIENKLSGTLGVFISRNPLTENFINALRLGRRQNVLVIHGEDLDELFKPESPSLSAYIEHFMKLLSYDHVAHFPFKDFAKTYISPEQKAMAEDETVRIFIEEYLNIPEVISKERLSEGYQALKPAIRKKVYHYAFTNFDVAWKHFQSSKTFGMNYRTLFELIDPKGKEIQGTENIYFMDKLPNDFILFGISQLVELYWPLYTGMDSMITNAFEEKMLAAQEKSLSYNDFLSQSRIAGVVAKLWPELSESTQELLKVRYIDTLMNKEMDNEALPKQLARKLISEEIINYDLLIAWFEKKVAFFFKNTAPDDEYTLDFFINTYQPIYAALGVKPNNQKAFVKRRAKQVIKKTQS